ncbi:MAG: phage head closure protein [Rickettsiales bacterium]
MALLASLLRHRITIEQPVRSTDGQGGYTKNWTALATVWARMSAGSGSENTATRQLASETAYRVTIRYRSDVTNAMRLNWNNRLFNIRTVIDPDGKQQSLVLTVEENVAM